MFSSKCSANWLAFWWTCLSVNSGFDNEWLMLRHSPTWTLEFQTLCNACSNAMFWAFVASHVWWSFNWIKLDSKSVKCSISTLVADKKCTCSESSSTKSCAIWEKAHCGVMWRHQACKETHKWCMPVQVLTPTLKVCAMSQRQAPRKAAWWKATHQSWCHCPKSSATISVTSSEVWNDACRTFCCCSCIDNVNMFCQVDRVRRLQCGAPASCTP